MPEYRTPEEDRAQDELNARIELILDQAVRDGASYMVAAELGEPENVVELWIDRIWNGLRDGLSDRHPQQAGMRLKPDEDRLAAIVFLLQERMTEESQRILTGLRSSGGGCE